MSYIGKTPTPVPLTSSDISDGIIITDKLANNAVVTSKITDGTIATADVANDAVTLAKMASGTDGNIISYDASGNPVAVATGNDGQVLTSTGAGSPPAFETPASAANTPSFLAYNGSTQSLANNTWVLYNFTSEVYDIGGGFNTSTKVYTVPEAGKYVVFAQVKKFGDGTFQQCKIKIEKNNSSAILGETATGVNNSRMSVNAYGVISCNQNDTLHVEVNQNSGGSLNFEDLLYNNYFGAFKLIGV